MKISRSPEVKWSACARLALQRKLTDGSFDLVHIRRCGKSCARHDGQLLSTRVEGVVQRVEEEEEAEDEGGSFLNQTEQHSKSRGR